MADATSTSPGRTNLSNRIGELTQRWLPMMLWRVGVSNSQTAMLRVAVDSEQGLRDRLDFAQGAVMFASARQTDADVCAADLAPSVIEIVSQLRLALDQGDADLDEAHRRVDVVNRRLIRLVVGAQTSPSVQRSSQIEFGSGRLAFFTPTAWWSRLISRGSGFAARAHA